MTTIQHAPAQHSADWTTQLPSTVWALDDADRAQTLRNTVWGLLEAGVSIAHNKAHSDHLNEVWNLRRGTEVGYLYYCYTDDRYYLEGIAKVDGKRPNIADGVICYAW